MEISNQIYLNILINEVQEEEFIKYEDIMQFFLIETAGASLPIIYLKILVRDKDIMNKFQSNNTVKVSVGNSKEDADTFEFHPLAPAPNKDPADAGWEIELVGFLGNNAYMFEQLSTTYEGNSLFVVDSVMQNYFGKEVILSEDNNTITENNKTIGKYIYTNFSGTNENQVVWRRNNTTAAYFVADTLLHADVRPSFPLFGFDRYQTFYVRDIDKLIKNGPTITFTAEEPKDSNEIQYINNFNVDSYKMMYDLYSGFSKTTEIQDVKSGLKSFIKAMNEPILASSSISDKVEGISTTLSINNTKSTNVHKTYDEAFAYNSNRLVALSSMVSVLYTAGKYHHKLKPTDLVTIKTGDRDTEISGRYLIDTVITTVNFGSGDFVTLYYVTRDNKNNVQNYTPVKTDWIKVKDKFYNDLLKTISNLKYAYATAVQFIDGRFMSDVLSYAIETKNNLLRGFRISGVMIDLADRYKGTLNSLIATGNALLNTLFDMIFPYQIANSLRDFVTMERNSLGVISKYVSEYVPIDVQDIVMKLIESLYGVTDTLNSIAEDNKGTVTVAQQQPVQNEYIAEGKQKVDNIVKGFERNTTGLDVPFPIVDLTESEALLPDDELKEFVADKTISELANAGYLTEDDTQQFKDILLGTEPINFEIINTINKNAGDTMNYRFWGTYEGNVEFLYAWQAKDTLVYTKDTLVYTKDTLVYTKDEVISNKTRLFMNDFTPYMGESFKVEQIENQWVITYRENPEDNYTVAQRNKEYDTTSENTILLDSYIVKKGYKDKYRTLPCTKLIGATKNSKIFFACPSSEANVKFYINSKRVELPSFETDLGYKSIYGNPLKYTVYYTVTGYNSNSVLFEVKQGGMV